MTPQNTGTEKNKNKTKPYKIKSSDRNISYTLHNKIPESRL